jgi:hypothetical protein
MFIAICAKNRAKNLAGEMILRESAKLAGDGGSARLRRWYHPTGLIVGAARHTGAGLGFGVDDDGF